MEAAPLALEHTAVQHFDRVHSYNQPNLYEERADVHQPRAPLAAEHEPGITDTYAIMGGGSWFNPLQAPPRRNVLSLRGLFSIIVIAAAVFIGVAAIAEIGLAIAHIGVHALEIGVLAHMFGTDMFWVVRGDVLASVFLGLLLAVVVALPVGIRAFSKAYNTANNSFDDLYRD